MFGAQGEYVTMLVPWWWWKTTLVTLLLGISVLDATQRRVGNAVVLAAACFALACRVLHPQLSSLPGGLLGALGALVLVVPLYAFGFVGAADAKIFAAYGAVVGADQLLRLTFYSSLAAGMLSVLYMGAWQLSAPAAFSAPTASPPSPNALERGRRARKTLPLAVGLSLGVLATLRGDALWQL